MYASITSVARVGVRPCPVQVEAAIGSGGKRFSIVGLPDAAVREAKDRVMAAFAATGLKFPGRSVIVNLSPADLPKAGTAYDLPIALAVLAATNTSYQPATRCVALGELALNGDLRPVVGGLAATVVGEDLGLPCVLPTGSDVRPGLLDTHDVRQVGNLAEAIHTVLHGHPQTTCELSAPPPAAALVDMADVRGQRRARRALELAAAGGHHMLMMGPPGSGKTMLAQALPGLLPDLPESEVLDVALAWAAAGLDRADWRRPPFRAPHHSATGAAMIGGGSGVPVPGEVTLAHRGVLFLDELGEFPVGLLDALRQPLEEGEVLVSRKGASMCFPSRFQLVAATNPCPCGYYDDSHVGCGCTPNAKQRYRRRFSGPLLDRVDVRVAVERLNSREMNGPPAETTSAVRARVAAARQRQRDRGSLNAELSRRQLDEMAWSGTARLTLTGPALEHLTARGFDRVRRLAATAADLEGTERIHNRHISEACALRADL